MQTSTQAVRARTDEPFLERFIEAHEAFVLRCASRHAGFAVTRSDDEYSVALLAFYEAIKGYDPARWTARARTPPCSRRSRSR